MNLIFDLDNTLIDRNTAYFKWLHALLEAKKLCPLSWQKIKEKDNQGYLDRALFYTWLIDFCDISFTVNDLIEKCANELCLFIQPDAKLLEMLLRWSQKHQLYIATNGGVLNQRNKIIASGISKIIPKQCIFISEEMGCRKPMQLFFERVQKHINNTEKIMMIGDDCTTDIKGAQQLQWKTVWITSDSLNKVNANYMIPDIYSLNTVLEL